MLKSANSNQKARTFSVPRIIFIILINLLEHGPSHQYINTMSHVLKQKILQVTFVLFLMSPHQILHLIFVYAGNQSKFGFHHINGILMEEFPFIIH